MINSSQNVGLRPGLLRCEGVKNGHLSIFGIVSHMGLLFFSNRYLTRGRLIKTSPGTKPQKPLAAAIQDGYIPVAELRTVLMKEGLEC